MNSVSYATMIDAHAAVGQLAAAQSWAAAAASDGVGLEPWVATSLLKAHVRVRAPAVTATAAAAVARLVFCTPHVVQHACICGAVSQRSRSPLAAHRLGVSAHCCVCAHASWAALWEPSHSMVTSRMRWTH